MVVREKPTAKNSVRYRPEFCEQLVTFFDIPAFSVTEVMKKDGAVSLLETASELPTFAGFAKKIGTTCDVLTSWEHAHPAFAQAAARARDLQGNILLQNSLRGNYASSFAIFTAKNLLGWKDSKEDHRLDGPLVVCWKENEGNSHGRP